MDLQDFADLALDRVERIERTHRLLEDHRDAVAARLAHGLVRGRQKICPIEGDDAARMMGGRIGQKFEDRHGRDRLAGAGLADQGHGLVASDREGNAVHRRLDPAALGEGDLEVVDGQKRIVGIRLGCGLRHGALILFGLLRRASERRSQDGQGHGWNARVAHGHGTRTCEVRRRHSVRTRLPPSRERSRSGTSIRA